ncbi:beta-ketoacyl synthase N-terminal-like domain-containing protein [Streptomyces gelaticus]|uniref:type I polyketide synthase n=1 Tax=Streptomyces gelaticus TaxID=285446 RepID=UPI0037ACCDFF
MPDAGMSNAPVRPNDVAVIGMCGRFPGAPDLTRFWSRLRAGDDMLTTFTEAELVAAGVPERVRRDPGYVNRAAVLPGAFGFDHEFFGYTRRDATLLDPQQRILLEVAWELLETVGYSSGADDQAIGVFAGASMNTYLTNAVARSCDPLGYEGTELMIANDKDYLTTRISYKLGLKGPSLNVQTACSTSLVAVHLAVQSLLTGECDIALAGGVSVIANSYPGYVFSEGMILSPDGRCRPFDAAGKGTTFGDGVGLVALKRLAEAIEDGDRILAVVKGSAINNDGADKIGYTAPSIGGQCAVISEAQAVAEADSDTITYVEAHGTATALGDPIEFAALSEAFTAGGARPGQCALGSVKANVGHLAAAAGITGFIKAVLALQHREIPGHPGFDTPNPEIDLARSPFYINTLPMAWPAGDTPRRAGVSSFGIGGTNAHVVLEEAPAQHDRQMPVAGPQLLVVSARSGPAVRELAGRLAETLASADAPGLFDAAYTLRRGRRGFAHRYAVLASDHTTAAAGLRAIADGSAADRPAAEAAPAVSFLFGEVSAEEYRALVAQFSALGDIADRYPVSDVVDAGNPWEFQVAASQVLAALWAESGVQPAAVGGAGAGEVLAACFAGVLDASDASALLSWRAGLLDHIPELRPRAPRMPVLSAVAGGELPQSQVLDPEHWTRDVWQGDRLADAFAGRAGDGAAVLAIGTPPDVLPAGSDLGIEPNLHSAERLLATAGRLWTEGVPVDWTGWTGGRPCRVPLPVHPLNRAFLRLEPPPAPGREEPVRAQNPARSRAQDPAEWLYTDSWRRLGPTAGAEAVGTLPDGPWLLFADSGGVCDSLATALRDRNADVVLVRHGDAFGRADADSFTVDPTDPLDHGKLLAALAADGRTPAQVVHFWCLDIAPGQNPADDLDGATELGLFSVLDIGRQLARGRDRGAQITVVAADVHAVTGSEVIAPAAAMTEAVLRVLPQESAGLHCRSIDIGTSRDVTQALLAELAAPSRTADLVAFRHGQRWTHHFVPVAAAPAGRQPTGRLRPGGVYLITGGLGRLGVLLAEHLARVAGATLVLTGRSPLPPPEEFDQWAATHGAEDPVSRKIRAVRDIERLGGTVWAATADVTDVRAMRDLVNIVRRRFGSIDGWFHCAGLPFDTAGARTGRADRAALRKILAPKVRGALVLAEVFAETPAAFGVMLSSPAAAPGGFGDLGDAVADRFFDAQSSAVGGLVCINWADGPTADVLDLVLSTDTPSRLAVSRTDLERRVKQPYPRREPVQPAGTARHQAPMSGDELKRALAKLWSDVLRTEIDQYDLDFFDMGGDELLAVRLARRIEEDLGLPLTAIDLLAHPTVDRLAARLDRSGPAAASHHGAGRRAEGA